MFRRLLAALCVMAACGVTLAVTRAVTPQAAAAEPVVLGVKIAPDQLDVGASTTIELDVPTGFAGVISSRTPTICSAQGRNSATITALAVGTCIITVECVAAPGAGTAAAATTTSSSSTSSSISSTTSSIPEPPECVAPPDVLVNVEERPVPEYVPLVPVRVLETRNIPDRGIDPIGGVPEARTGTRPAKEEIVKFNVLGKSTFRGAAVPPRNAEAVVLNVTGVDVAEDGFVTAWECAPERPVVSNLNLTHLVLTEDEKAKLIDPDARANLVVTKMDEDGNVCLFVQHATHLVADLNGYFPPGAPYTAKRPPKRVLETREGEVGFQNAKPLAGEQVVVDLSKDVEVGTKAVVLNITGVNTTAPGFVTVWNCDDDPPTTSNLNLPGNLHATPNLVVSALSAAKTVCVRASVSTDLVVDLFGEFQAASKFTALTPVRVLETRTTEVGGRVNYTGEKPEADSVIKLTFAASQITTAGEKPDAVALNVTGTDPTDAGFVTVWPCEEKRPLASNVNMARLGTGQSAFPAVSNLIIAKTDTNGAVCLYTQKSTHLVVDLYGYFPFGSAGG